MRNLAALGAPYLVAAVLLGAMVQTSAPSRPPAVPRARFPGERASSARRDEGGVHRILRFSGPIQHVVVIYMENRTPDDLLGGYYRTLGSALDLYNPVPQTGPTLAPNPLGAHFDPYHSHDLSFVPEAAGDYGEVGVGCVKALCPPDASVYSYVPAPEASPYVALIGNFAYASHVLQANEGPSFAAHQYAIAGQSGGLNNWNGLPQYQFAPDAQSENPENISPSVAPNGAHDEETSSAPLGNCFTGNSLLEYTLDMSLHYPALDGDPHPPCVEYDTILDEIAAALGPPALADWQYIASVPNGMWAAPMAVHHLYDTYRNGYPPNQSFAVDPDAVDFVRNLQARTPRRPFAALTYITPCIAQSDHPMTQGTSNGPAWIAYLVNAIGKSRYWPNTTIVVTWDDWGGFFDHYRTLGAWPYHPHANPYNNPADPNEWGFRVPLIVISPYVRSRGYVSTGLRSQSAILNYIESTFALGSLGTDDMTNGGDDLGDIFDFNRPPPGLPYVSIDGGRRFDPNDFSCSNG